MYKKLFLNITLGLLITLSPTIIHAQNDDTETNSTPVVSLESNLVADKENRAADLKVVDSMLMKIAIEHENDFLHPADDLYSGLWNNEHVNAYGQLTIPDEYTLDVSSFVIPAEGRVTSKYGWRKRRPHYGIDLKVQTGDPIKAAFDGEVRIRKYDRRGYGYYLVLRHSNGLETVYGHLSKFMVEEGEKVKAGDVIGLGGNTGRSTGSHLHFEFRFLGQTINPEEIVDFENQCVKEDLYVFKKGVSGMLKSSSSSAVAQKSNGPVKYYKIKDGDTLGAIARRHKTTVNSLCRLNNIKATTTLRVGRSIRVS